MPSPDSSNEKATIGFVIYYPFQFYLYKNIYKYLKDKAEFIVDMGPFAVKQPEGLRGDIEKILQKNGAAYRVIEFEDYYAEEYINNFLEKYQALVSVWENGCVSHRAAQNLKKIHYMYGCSKELTFVRPEKGLFDLALAFGERGKKLLSYYTKSEVVGNARFDDWFSGGISIDEDLSKILNRLDSSKKTILYLPTHSDLSSIDSLADSLKGVTEQYNVLVKLHYFATREEPEKIEKLRHPGIHIFNDEVDALPLFQKADVVISDNSSAIFDAILVDKPVLTTDFLDEEFLNFSHKERRMYRRGLMGAATYAGSLEQQIKKEGKVVVLKKPNNLREKIEVALCDGEKYKQARQEIREETMSFNDGKCGQRAAKAIEECIPQPVPERPILYHAFEAYKRKIGISSYESVRRSREAIQRYENLLIKETSENKRPYFSIIVVDDFPENLGDTLHSLVWQKYPRELYEILIVTSSSDAYVRGLVKKGQGLETPPLSVIASEETNTATIFQECLSKAKGSIVLLTTSGCIAPYDWLLKYVLSVGEFPLAAGWGGFVSSMNLENTKNTFAEFSYYETGKQLGTWKTIGYSRDFYAFENNLFYQNPFGKRQNTAYTKEILGSLDWQTLSTSSWDSLELLIKHAVMQREKVAFLYSAVTRIQEETYKEFKNRNIEYGVALGFLAYTDLILKKYYTLSLGSVFRQTILFLFDNYGQGKMRMMGVVFLASVFRWVGSLIFLRECYLKVQKK